MYLTIIYLHIIVAILAQTVAVLATGISTFFLIQQRNIKRKKITVVIKSPFSLEVLDEFFSKLLWLGFVFLSFSVLSGFVLFLYFKPQIKYMELKIIWSLLVWFWYFVSTLLRHRYFKSRTVSAQMCSLGFIILLSTCFGFIF